jgi:hypothetical protein
MTRSPVIALIEPCSTLIDLVTKSMTIGALHTMRRGGASRNGTRSMRIALLREAVAMTI